MQINRVVIPQEFAPKKKEDDMPRRKSLPNLGSYKAAREWLDTHSTADLYAKPANFSVSPNLQVFIIDA